MAPHRLLLLAAIVTTAFSILAASHAAHDSPSGHLPAADTTVVPRTTVDGDVVSRGSSPPSIHSADPITPHTTVDADVLRAAADGSIAIPAHLIRPAVILANGTDDLAVVPRTVYDVTVIFRASRRLGPPRLQYYVVPAGACVPVPAADVPNPSSASASAGACGDGSGFDTFATVLVVAMVTGLILALYAIVF